MGPGIKRLFLRGNKCSFARWTGGGRPVAHGASLRVKGPVKNLHLAAGIFDKGGTAFNPVAVVKVEHAPDAADLGKAELPAVQRQGLKKM
jgi:hypothetical protein